MYYVISAARGLNQNDNKIRSLELCDVVFVTLELL